VTKEIYTMARKSYLAVKLGKPSELYDMVHTENFVRSMQKEGAWLYDGTNKEDIKKLIIDINFLTVATLKKKTHFYLFNTKSLILFQDLIYLIVSIK
jgi:hypothetical protein